VTGGAVLADVGNAFGSTAASGSLLLAVPVALLAGVVSFASPCVLPLVPGYLGFLGGMTGAAGSRSRAGRGGGVAVATRDPARVRVLLGVALFVLGFTAVFVAYGVLAGSIGGALVEHQAVIERVLGVVVILMGLAFLGFVPFLQREKRLHLAPRAGLWGAPLLGVTFGLGWTPCIGPTLAAILTLSLDGGSAGRGALLAVMFCLGLGLPFLLVALGVESSARMMAFLRRHRLAIMRLGGALLVVLGLALVTGVWGDWAAWLQQLLTGSDAFRPVV
jgi:cytochrome c-type biogenesis protein